MRTHGANFDELEVQYASLWGDVHIILALLRIFEGCGHGGETQPPLVVLAPSMGACRARVWERTLANVTVLRTLDSGGALAISQVTLASRMSLPSGTPSRKLSRTNGTPIEIDSNLRVSGSPDVLSGATMTFAFEVVAEIASIGTEDVAVEAE